MKQTAVEWLENELDFLSNYIDEMARFNLFKQAKEMEKERMFEVYHGYQDYLDNEFKNQLGGQSVILTFEEYYNETFKTK